MTKIIENFVDGVIAIIIVLFTICNIIIFVYTVKTPNGDDGSSPVKDNEIVDSLKTENTKLIIEITKLDSVKDVKIIEVKNLNNDSTLELFYELIRE